MLLLGEKRRFLPVDHLSAERVHQGHKMVSSVCSGCVWAEYNHDDGAQFNWWDVSPPGWSGVRVFRVGCV